jgi:nucleoside-diphosphate-sugar epimerase
VDGHWVFYFAPPAPTGHSDQRIGHWLHSLVKQRPAKVVLISTTGVYGDCGGRWITEAAPINPQTDRACRRVDAERQIQQWCDARQLPYAILRVPGIYGPRRLPRARLEHCLPVLAEAESPYSNRIHVDDLIRACLAAASSDFIGVVHVSDGHPSTMTDYFNRVADALRLPRPEQISREEAQQILSREMLSYLSESKRMDITRMRTVLGVEPDYPDLDRGLSDCVASEKAVRPEYRWRRGRG